MRYISVAIYVDVVVENYHKGGNRYMAEGFRDE